MRSVITIAGLIIGYWIGTWFGPLLEFLMFPIMFADNSPRAFVDVIHAMQRSPVREFISLGFGMACALLAYQLSKDVK